ncbi:formate--tetrahydrofolate ligase [Nostocoides veronense]|uniref:Formate--tetrahydrofolate ligase n=1 Tax=Nostocoides veronense TaxID=330836 RepID=A0ABN2L8R2_9MICO
MAVPTGVPPAKNSTFATPPASSACAVRSTVPRITELSADDAAHLVAKIEAVAKQVYGADGVDIAPPAAKALAEYERLGFGGLPVVIAKTNLSISHDPALLGAPTGWRLPVREVRAAAGAGYVYAICGDMRTMPGLSSHPNAEKIDLVDGEITGLS